MKCKRLVATYKDGVICILDNEYSAIVNLDSEKILCLLSMASFESHMPYEYFKRCEQDEAIIEKVNEIIAANPQRFKPLDEEHIRRIHKMNDDFEKRRVL